jgi:nucleotide-binding universal stress UspA family protein
MPEAEGCAAAESIVIIPLLQFFRRHEILEEAAAIKADLIVMTSHRAAEATCVNARLTASSPDAD